MPHCKTCAARSWLVVCASKTKPRPLTPGPTPNRYAEGVSILSRSPAHWNRTHGWELVGRPRQAVPSSDAMQSNQPWSTFHWMRANSWSFVGANVDQGFFLHMYRVRNQWPFGIDLCCLPPEKHTHSLSSYSLLHFFNKPFRSNICGQSTKSNGVERRAKPYHQKVRAYHEDVARALQDAVAMDSAVVPPELERANCIAHSLAEEVCARNNLFGSNSSSRTAQKVLPLHQNYGWLTPFQSCRQHARSHSRGRERRPYCPEDMQLGR